MFSARDQYRLPADCPLLVDDAEGAINIAALQRQRMIEDVKYPHFYENWIGHAAGAGIAHVLCGRYPNSEQLIIYDVLVNQPGPLGNATMTANIRPRPHAAAETNRAPGAAPSAGLRARKRPGRSQHCSA